MTVQLPTKANLGMTQRRGRLEQKDNDPNPFQTEAVIHMMFRREPLKINQGSV